MVSSAIIKKLKAENCKIITSTRNQLDLTDKVKVFEFYKSNLPDVVILSAAKVGGIHANNTYPVDFLLENLFIQNNIISGAHNFSVKNYFFLVRVVFIPKILMVQSVKIIYLPAHLKKLMNGMQLQK
jgi:GDP-L-fucose synthase